MGAGRRAVAIKTQIAYWRAGARGSGIARFETVRPLISQGFRGGKFGREGPMGGSLTGTTTTAQCDFQRELSAGYA